MELRESSKISTAESTRRESSITFRDALEPWNICPFQAWVNESLGSAVVNYHVLVQRATHRDRLCGAPGAINLITAGLSNLVRVGSVKSHTHILFSHVSSDMRHDEYANFLAPAKLGGINGDKKRLDAALFCELYNALRHGTVLVDISLGFYGGVHE